ncbi:5'-nucleotidase, lipoprotein e(P4) family [Thermomonas aquatica]
MRLMSSLLAAALLVGCASHAAKPEPPPAPAPAATAEAPATPPADDSLNATAWFQTSVERDLVYRAIYRAAAVQLPAALADKRWDALQKEDRGNDPRKLPPAIIVDVDETVLDNSPSSVRQIREQRGFDDANWNLWVNERKAKALPGAAEFLNAAAKRGVTIFYISNRTADQAQATIDNLRSAGFPIKDASQFLGLGTVVEGCEQEGSEKSCRRQLVGRGYRVLMQFGDQVGDFVQILANTPEGRRAAIAPYADWIGQRWWALPNPLYGSWEPALFNNAWSQPAGERRAQKEAALDDAK